MRIVTDKISNSELKGMAEKTFGDFVKAVVDVEKRVMVVDAGLHADEERMLLDEGSEQEDLWGINLYPEFFGSSNWIEFDSMIKSDQDKGTEVVVLRTKLPETALQK